ncbi:thioredoxin domain-containing protein [Deminuibacter soli]|uniref:Thioredoxin domain-containing protein n=1 Tax=Deminuibacter soli TaxID=2291815 RepID=A0A3E1NFE6_9BACT|nr:thioredoxin domain-containing protein [Deminuibacter soli]RFM26597.1 thioredoxin domain-containing protein [Deminuibacter soli]
MSNRLINETSPYLLQHAHNPVDWYPWGPEALEKAKAENKPILVSIGYAACHWCHVMEKESFENDATAALMNRSFINIKIDREERPDLDHIYMDAVQALTGSGGWPLNAFLTPDGKPFYGGTYYPPVSAYQRPSWTQVLESINDAWQNKREEIEAQAGNLTDHLLNANSFGIRTPGAEETAALFTRDNLQQIAANILTQADTEWGGFGHAPKFPQTFAIQFLLRHHYFTGSEPALQQALLSIDKMIDGGIYDQAGGGFARYSTDKEWLAPHFEKMLYDNALLVAVLAEAYQLTGRQQYANVIHETLAFVERELYASDGGFYSALDADSEGVEGKFYTWQKAEINELLGNDAGLFCQLYDVQDHGNWEHTNILWIPGQRETVAAAHHITVQQLEEKMQAWKTLLLQRRAQRVRPALDNKILLGWNALMTTAYCKAYAATGNTHYREVAEKNIRMLSSLFSAADGGLFHSLKKDQPPVEAFLDDYAYFVQALVALQEITGEVKYLARAKELMEYVEMHFAADGGYFFYTHNKQQDVIVRKKEVYDGATPSGNATMAFNLLYLSVAYNRPQWYNQAETMIAGLGQAITRYPTSFGVWAGVVQLATMGLNEIVVTGTDPGNILNDILRCFIPNKIIQSSSATHPDFPLLAGKPVQPETAIFLCKNYACHAPVYAVQELIKSIRSGM